MSRSDAVPPGAAVEAEAARGEQPPPRLARPIPSTERAFRWLIGYRSQPLFEHVPGRAAA